MKQKLWIVAAAVVLLAALWCGCAMAEERSFTLRNKVITVTPDIAGCIEWDAEGFEPVRFKVMYSYHEGDFFTGTTHKITVRDLDRFKIQYSLDMDKAEEMLHINPMGSWYVAAYYGDGDDDYIPAYFGVNIDKGTLTVTPETVEISPDVPGVVNWSVFGFYPRKVKLMYIYQGEDLEYHEKTVREVDRDAESFTLSLAEARAEKKAHYFGKWYVYAYYGDGDDDYLSAWFETSLSTGTVAVSDQEIEIQPGKYGLIQWGVDGFAARKYQVVYEYLKNGSSRCDTVAELSGSSYYYCLEYDTANETTRDTYGSWFVRAFYGEGTNDYVETGFSVVLNKGSADVGTKTVLITPDVPGRLSWTTSGYTPVKTQVIYHYWEGDSFSGTSHNITVKTLSRGTTECDLSFEEVRDAMADNPTGSWWVLVYYGNGDSDFNGAVFQPTLNTGTVTVSSKTVVVTPDGGGGITWPGHDEVTWTVNGFTPEKYRIVYSWWEGDILTGSSHSVTVKELDELKILWHPDFFEVRQTEADHLYGGTWSLRAYYGSGENDYVSDSFTFGYDTGWVEAEPETLQVAEDTPGQLAWTVSGFTPRKFKLVYSYWEDGYLIGTQRKITVKEMNGSAESCELSWDDVGDVLEALPANADHGNWYLLAYYGPGENDCNAALLDVQYLIRHFTVAPQGGNYAGNDGWSISWETNFPTTSIRIFEVDALGNPVQDHPVALSAAKDATCYVIYLPEDRTSCRFRVMAGYGPEPDEYVLSAPFTVSRYGFDLQPRSGFISGFTEDEDRTPYYTVQWSTTFTPADLWIVSTDENGVRDDDDELIVLKPDNDDTQFSVPLPVSRGDEGCFRIIARYDGNPGGYVYSSVFRVTHARVLSCDESVTLTPEDGGQLHFTTNYVPVKAELYLSSPSVGYELYDTIWPVTTDCVFDLDFYAAEDGAAARVAVYFQRDGAAATVYESGIVIDRPLAFLEAFGPGNAIVLGTEDYFCGILSGGVDYWEVYRRPAGDEEAEWVLDGCVEYEETDTIEYRITNYDGIWGSYDYFMRAYSPDRQKRADSRIVQIDFEGCVIRFDLNGGMDNFDISWRSHGYDTPELYPMEDVQVSPGDVFTVPECTIIPPDWKMFSHWEIQPLANDDMPEEDMPPVRLAYPGGKLTVMDEYTVYCFTPVWTDRTFTAAYEIGTLTQGLDDPPSFFVHQFVTPFIPADMVPWDANGNKDPYEKNMKICWYQAENGVRGDLASDYVFSTPSESAPGGVYFQAQAPGEAGEYELVITYKGVEVISQFWTYLPAQSNHTYQFSGSLDKVYDGEPAAFDFFDRETFSIDGGKGNWGALVKNEEACALWRRYSGETGEYADLPAGTLPTAPGRYQLVIQESDGKTWQDAYVISFEIAYPEPEGLLILPASLTVIEADAFSSVSAQGVFIPAAVTVIEGNPFAGSAVQYIFGVPGDAEHPGAAKVFADSCPEYLFVPVDDAWIASY